VDSICDYCQVHTRKLIQWEGSEDIRSFAYEGVSRDQAIALLAAARENLIDDDEAAA